MSSSFKEFGHLQIPLKDITSTTKNFAYENLVGETEFGKIYQGQLMQSTGQLVDIAAWRLDRRYGQGEVEFWKEISMLSHLNHKSILSIFGFCDEQNEKIIVTERAVHGGLDRHLSSPTLTWMQRLRICSDAATALSYIHRHAGHSHVIIHGDIKSSNILLDRNWKVKLRGFNLSISYLANRRNRLLLSPVCGTMGYLDPVFVNTGSVTVKSDVYSLGVVFFEVLCGREAWKEDEGGHKFLAPLAKECYEDGKLDEIIDPGLRKQMDPQAFIIFSDTAYGCLNMQRAQRPDMENVVKSLEEALEHQRTYETPENNRDNLKFSLEDIKMATHYFSDDNCIGRGGFGKVYKGEVPHANGHMVSAIKRLDKTYGQGQHEYLTEIEILSKYKHENIIGLLGYCDEKGEKIIVYEYASRGSLDRYLKDDCFTWMKRLEICIDVAIGLDFLHGGSLMQEVVIHRDIKSSNILLNEDWVAKISDFGLSMKCPINKEIDYVIEGIAGAVGYCDPIYMHYCTLTKESDMYSLGVVLFEILCGRLGYIDHPSKHLINVVKDKWKEGRLEEIVFKGIKDDIVPESLTTYSKIAYQCLDDVREKRPTANDVLIQLKKALKFQVDPDIWEPKLPKDYKKIIEMTSSPEIYLGLTKEDLYTMFLKGILLQEDKLCFSLGNNGEKNEMVSAKKLSYKNRMSYKWRSVSTSRFPKVAEILDISNLEIQVKIRTQLLSVGVNYGVHLICRFCGPRKSPAKRMYVNLKYKKGNEKLHAYFATWREDEWMMIELFRLYNCKEDTDFQVLLESLSRCYSGSRAIYIEGIEFRAIDNVKHEEIDMSEEVQVMKSNLQSDEGGKLHSSATRMETTKDQMFFVKNKVLNETFDGEPVTSRSKGQFRFDAVTELLRQQVFYIRCKIKSQTLSPNIENVCYLMFKLSEKCRGLHCPVRVRNLHLGKKDTRILYFRTPSPWNLHNTDWVPKTRTDGWMEVIVWKFNSTYPLKNGDLFVNLKLISYEGTMSGLILRGLEFRPM